MPQTGTPSTRDTRNTRRAHDERAPERHPTAGRASAGDVRAATSRDVPNVPLSLDEAEVRLGRWLASRVGLPATGAAYLTSGDVMSTFVALKAARDAHAGWRIRDAGTRGGPPLTIYASSQAHDANARAADMLGLGRDAVRVVPCDADLRMRVDALRGCLASDVRCGRQPVAVIAAAGTPFAGAVDPIDAIADVCAEHRLWLHVDGACGGGAALTDALRPRFRGIERADSVALDSRDWLHASPSVGVLLVRDALAGDGVDLSGLGAPHDRALQALQLWVALLTHGWPSCERRVARDVALARRLHARAAASAVLEPVGPPPTLAVACFRYAPRDLRDRRGDARADAYLNDLNARLASALRSGGRAWPASAAVDGRLALSARVADLLADDADVDALVERAESAGDALRRDDPPERAAAGAPARGRR